MSKHITITRTSTPEIEKRIEDITQFINGTRITGEINKSKIMRLALVDWLDKQDKIKQILERDKEINKSAEDILRENELL